MKIYIIFIFVIVFICCKRNDLQEDYSHPAILDSTCIANYSSAYADSMILVSAKKFQTRFGINDPCYLNFLDSLTIRTFTYQNEKDFILLDSLYRVSDGYVGEIFMSIGITLFGQCYDKILKYSEKFYPQDISKSPLVQLIPDALEFEKGYYEKGYYDIYLDKDLDSNYVLDRLNYYYSIETNLQSQKIIKNLEKQVKTGFK